MKLSSISKNITIAALTVLMSHVPNVALADVVIQRQEMVSAGSVLADISREEAAKEVKNYLSKTEVQAELMKHGLTADEVNTRLASLSKQELQQLAGQVQEARAGGDVLVTILVVILIIFLVQRI